MSEDDELTTRKAERLRQLASSNFSKFAIQVEHLSTEVQMKLIAQLPEFQKLAAGALEKVSDAHRETLRSMGHNENQVHEAFEEWRAALRTLLDDSSLTLDEKLRVTSEIGRTVREQADLQAQNHRAKVAMFGKVAVGSLMVVGSIVVAVTGGKFGIDQGDKSA
ncbi:hypothetical protein [Curtobacterium sp. VKM Ac-1395]|uniref:hypothetical protein n=1 Tax=Curtobacterium sp. VKM Ac-1395 TaxID=2783815 RepID=UPI00188BBC85|nr:hypothetical protein [Curtobacterium sp. VKM Ac-1395]MBF4591609.1 hypothetical protein [Curtobacterium sp. VKM Ac-1395]